MAEEKQVVFYKGTKITELSRDELVEALQLCMEHQREQQKHFDEEREMRDFFAKARAGEGAG